MALFEELGNALATGAALTSTAPQFEAPRLDGGHTDQVGDWINPEAIARDVVVVGASAGGVRAVIQLISGFPANFPGSIGIVIHRGHHSKANWSHTLATKTGIRVLEPRNGELLAPGTAYIAPSDRHMRFESGGVVLDDGPKENGTRPAVDPLFRSAAFTYGARVVGVVLTGGGSDGTRGVLAITAAGGLSLAQAIEEADAASMPENAILFDHVSAVLPLTAIAGTLVRLSHGETIAY